MTAMTEVLDNLVRAVREKGDFSDARFVYSGRQKDAECPLETFIVACGVGQVTVLPMEVVASEVKAELCFDIYARSGGSKRDLTAFCDRFLCALNTAECGYLTENIKAADADFDTNLCVWHQKVLVSVVYEICESLQDSGYLLFADGVRVPGVREFEVTQSSDGYPIKEFLSGVTGYGAEVSEKYLVVSTNARCDMLESGVFALEEKINGTVYTGCRLVKFTVKSTGLDREYKYTLGFEDEITGDGGL